MQNRLHPLAATLEIRHAVAGRLRQAVQAAGGNRAVAERSGVPLGTVNNYVGARTGMKMGALAQLATACGVTLEWLASGDRPGRADPAPKAMPSALTSAAMAGALADEMSGAIPSAPLSSPVFRRAPASLDPPEHETGIDTALLAKAIEIVAAIDGGSGLHDDPHVVARRIAAAYAVLTKPSARRATI